MFREVLCAANWKLHKNPVEARKFLCEFLNELEEEEQKHFFIFPPPPILESSLRF